MPYSTSSSKKIALRKIRDIHKKANLIEDLHNKQKVIDFDIHQMTFHSAIILTCASLEQYLVTIFDDWLIKLQKGKAKFKNVPDALKTYFLMKHQIHHMKSLVAHGDEFKYTTETSVNQKYYAILNPRRLVNGIEEFKDFKFYSKKSFPSEENIKKMFSIIGFPSVFHELSVRGKRSFKLSLNSFLDVRNSIAHRQAPDLTIGDMIEHFRIIRLLIHLLDKILYSHIFNVSGLQFWPHA